MWDRWFRGWFYLSVGAAIVTSLRALDLYWLMLELGMVIALLGRHPLYDRPEEPGIQRPLTVFMVIPFTVYVTLALLGAGDDPLFLVVRGMITMMATLLLCLFLVLILVKRTTFHMNYRFVLGFSTVTAISLASLFALFDAAHALLTGGTYSNEDLMHSLINVMVFGIASGLLFKRDMRRMDYTALIRVPVGDDL